MVFHPTLSCSFSLFCCKGGKITKTNYKNKSNFFISLFHKFIYSFFDNSQIKWRECLPLESCPLLFMLCPGYEDDTSRTILHVDIDCFYAQVEAILDPALATLPLGIRQKNIVITTNYVARQRASRTGIPLVELEYNQESKRNRFRACQSRSTCTKSKTSVPIWSWSAAKISPTTGNSPATSSSCCPITSSPIIVPSKNSAWTRTSSTSRGWSRRGGNHANGEIPWGACTACSIFLFTFTSSCVARRPDVVGHLYGTEETFDGEDDGAEMNLAIGSEIAGEIRAVLKDKMGLTSSCGIGHNKLVAKLVGSKHKPDQASIQGTGACLPTSRGFWNTFDFSKRPYIRGCALNYSCHYHQPNPFQASARALLSC